MANDTPPFPSTELLTPNPCKLRVTCGADGIWLHFESDSGLHASLHVGSIADKATNLTKCALNDWHNDRVKQAQVMRGMKL